MARKSSTETATNANPELMIALDLLEKEKGIKKEVIIEAIRVSLEAAYKKNFTKDEKLPRDKEAEGAEQEKHKSEAKRS